MLRPQTEEPGLRSVLGLTQRVEASWPYAKVYYTKTRCGAGLTAGESLND
jgi:hypothetical protein